MPTHLAIRLSLIILVCVPPVVSADETGGFDVAIEWSPDGEIFLVTRTTSTGQQVTHAAETWHGRVNRLVIRDTQQSGFDVESIVDPDAIRTVVQNGTFCVLLSREPGEPEPQISIDADQDQNRLILHTSVPNCCALAGFRFIDLDYRECSVPCDECQCLACISPCPPVPEEPDYDWDFICAFDPDDPGCQDEPDQSMQFSR